MHRRHGSCVSSAGISNRSSSQWYSLSGAIIADSQAEKPSPPGCAIDHSNPVHSIGPVPLERLAVQQFVQGHVEPLDRQVAIHAEHDECLGEAANIRVFLD